MQRGIADFCPMCRRYINPVSEYTSMGGRLMCPICGTTLCFVPDGTTLREEVIIRSKRKREELDRLILNKRAESFWLGKKND